jgi:dimethylargininase
MFRIAIVRKPCTKFPEGITTAGLGKPDFKKALIQHQKYIDALKECGLEVKILEADEKFPDSTFVEDTAICTSKCAIITNPGAASRNGEKTVMKSVLKEYFNQIEEIKFPCTLDGGDVMKVENHFYIGISERTNKEGSSQLIGILNKYGYSGSVIELKNILHLKTGVSYLENNNLLVSGELINIKEFEKFNKIVISSEESYSANSLWINGKVLIPKRYPLTKEKIEMLGYRTIELDMSEFRKLDGGLSCLSLRF